MIPFWEYFFVDQSEESARDFFMRSNEAIILGEEKLRKNPGDKILISMLSGLYGYQSLVASGESNIRTALRTGRTGFGYTKELLEFDESIPETPFFSMFTRKHSKRLAIRKKPLSNMKK